MLIIRTSGACSRDFTEFPASAWISSPNLKSPQDGSGGLSQKTQEGEFFPQRAGHRGSHELDRLQTICPALMNFPWWGGKAPLVLWWKTEHALSLLSQTLSSRHSHPSPWFICLLMAVSRNRLQWCRRQPKHNLAFESREGCEKRFGKGRCCWESMKRKSRQRGYNGLIWQRRQAGFEYAKLTRLCEAKGLVQKRCRVPPAVCSFILACSAKSKSFGAYRHRSREGSLMDVLHYPSPVKMFVFFFTLFLDCFFVVNQLTQNCINSNTATAACNIHGCGPKRRIDFSCQWEFAFEFRPVCQYEWSWFFQTCCIFGS